MKRERFLDSVRTLGKIGWEEGKGLFRMGFTEAFVKGRDYVAALMRDAGMSVHVDPVGNLFGRYDGPGPEKKAILMGSHLDSVPGGGIYDGHLGVLSALEAARSLHEKGLLHCPVEVVGFNAEEGGEMGGTFGSRAVCGEVKSLPASDVLASLNLTPKGIEASRLDFSRYRAWFELHIEQGPVLWRRKIPIGIPSAIVGITRFRISVAGESNHAGTTPMEDRKDAMKAAVRLLSCWYDEVERMQGQNFVCNIGTFSLEPGSAPVVPGRASFVLELRSTEPERIKVLEQKFRDLLPQAILPVTMEPMIDKPGTQLDAHLRDMIRETCTEMGIEFLDMPSGAGHDTVPISRKIPSAMIFVPSIGGISHSMAEETADDDMVRGTELLERVLAKFH